MRVCWSGAHVRSGVKVLGSVGLTLCDVCDVCDVFVSVGLTLCDECVCA